MNGSREKNAGQAGMSLVELMISLALSMILMAGVIQIFAGSKDTFRFNQAISRMQGNARFALEILSRELRMAGYMGCAANAELLNVLDPDSPNYVDWAFDFDNAIAGYDQSEPASLPDAFSADALAGNDAVVVIGMDPSAFTIESHTPPSAQFKLYQSHDLEDDEVVFVTDCQQGAIFQITNANQANVTIVHNQGTGTIGNLTKALGCEPGTVCDEDGNGYPDEDKKAMWKEFGSDAFLARLRSVAFYIGTGASGEPALFWEKLSSGGTESQELVDGIENMQIIYGYDSDNDNVPNQYLTADQVIALDVWKQIIAVRISLLVRSIENNLREDPDTRTYTVGNESIGTATTISHPADKRMRQVVTTTIQIRNRG